MRQAGISPACFRSLRRSSFSGPDGWVCVASIVSLPSSCVHSALVFGVYPLHAYLIAQLPTGDCKQSPRPGRHIAANLTLPFVFRMGLKERFLFERAAARMSDRAPKRHLFS